MERVKGSFCTNYFKYLDLNIKTKDLKAKFL